MMLAAGSVARNRDHYLAELRRRNLAERSIRTYEWAFALLIRWLEEHDATTLSVVQLRAFQSDLLADPNISQRSRGLVVSAVRGFIRWMEIEELAPAHLSDALERVPRPPRLPRPLLPEHVRQVEAWMIAADPGRPRPQRVRKGRIVARTGARRIVWLRDRALFRFLLYSGARISEACALDRTAFGRKSAWVEQKGGHQHELVYAEAVASAVEEYLEARTDDHEALFVTHERNAAPGRLAPYAARGIMDRLAKQAGVPRFTPHQLRHTMATEMLDAGAPPEVVAAQLGHVDLRTLQNYAKVSRSRRAKAADSMERFIERAKREEAKVAAREARRAARSEAKEATARTLRERHAGQMEAFLRRAAAAG